MPQHMSNFLSLTHVVFVHTLHRGAKAVCYFNDSTNQSCLASAFRCRRNLAHAATSSFFERVPPVFLTIWSSFSPCPHLTQEEHMTKIASPQSWVNYCITFKLSPYRLNSCWYKRIFGNLHGEKNVSRKIFIPKKRIDKFKTTHLKKTRIALGGFRCFWV